MPDPLLTPPDADTPHDLLTVNECAKRLRVSVCTIYDKARRGELPSLKLGARVLFPKADLDAWMSKEVRRRRGHTR